MKFSKLPFVGVLALATLFIVGCGDDKDPRFSNEDAAYLKQKRLQEMYGGTQTNTSTVTSTVTVMNTTTVNAN